VNWYYVGILPILEKFSEMRSRQIDVARPRNRDMLDDGTTGPFQSQAYFFWHSSQRKEAER
jgi:hypothetical protein